MARYREPLFTQPWPCFNLSILEQIITSSRFGATVVIEKRQNEIVTSLIISDAHVDDSGDYTCDPTSSFAKSVSVHVNLGEFVVVLFHFFSRDIRALELQIGHHSEHVGQKKGSEARSSPWGVK